MNINKAKAIITQAKIEEIYEGGIPDDDEKAIEQAEKLVALARDAWNQHVRGPEVEAILRIADDEFAGEQELEIVSEASLWTNPTVVEEETVEEVIETIADTDEPWPGYDSQNVSEINDQLVQSVEDFDGDHSLIIDFLMSAWKYESEGKARKSILSQIDKLGQSLDDAGETVEEEQSNLISDSNAETNESIVLPEVNDSVAIEHQKPVSDESYHAVLEMVENELANDRKHVPEPPADEAPELPWDWTKASDTEIQSLYSYYSLLAYYKSFVLIREDRVALECKRAADELANELLKVSNKYDEKGKEKRVTLLEAEVEADPHVSNWRRLQRKHEAYAASARRERDSLYKLVESLSRFETMRQQEWQRSGQNYR